MHSRSLQRFEKTGYICLVLTALMAPVSITGTAIFINLAILLSVISGNYREKWQQIKGNPMVWVGLFIVVLAIIGVTWSTGPVKTQLSAIHKYMKLLYIPFLLPLVKDERWRYYCINAFLVAVSFMLMLAYMKWFGWVSIGVYRFYDNPVAIFSNYIDSSYILALGGFFFAHRLFDKTPLRWLYLLLLLMITFSLFFLNNGRVGYLIFIVLAIMFFVQRFGWKGLLYSVLAIGLVVGAASLFSYRFRSRMEFAARNIVDYQKGNLYRNSIGYRISFAKNSWTLIKRRPVLGTGTGSFAHEYKQFGKIPGWDGELITPHNDFVFIAVQLGALGLFALLLFFYFQWRMSFHLGKNKWLAQGLVLSFVIACLTDAFLYHAVTGYLYVVLSVVFFSAYKRRSLA